MELLAVAATDIYEYNSGFWMRIGKPIAWGIDQITFMSVIWVNFLGCMIETPTVVWLVLRKRDRLAPMDWRSWTCRRCTRGSSRCASAMRLTRPDA